MYENLIIQFYLLTFIQSFSFHLNIEAKNWELFGGVYAEDTKRLGI